MNRYDAVLFDVDDTLLDFDASEQAACRHVLDECIRVPPGQRDAFVDAFLKEHYATWNLYMEGALLRQDVPRRTFERLSVTGRLGTADPDEAAELFRYWFASHSVPEPGALETLTLLHTHCRTGVISNYELADVQRARLAGAGLTPLLDITVISGDCGCEKPDPTIFRKTLQLLRLGPHQCLYVGDSLRSDAAGARSAGIDFCWYRRHCPSVDVPGINAVASLDELPSFLGLPSCVDRARPRPTMEMLGKN